MATTPSALDTSTNTDTDITTATTTTKLYEYIASYNFSSDLEFRKGLGTILGHPETPVSDSELLKEDDNVVLQAKCFYISRFVSYLSSLRRKKKILKQTKFQEKECITPNRRRLVSQLAYRKQQNLCCNSSITCSTTTTTTRKRTNTSFFLLPVQDNKWQGCRTGIPVVILAYCRAHYNGPADSRHRGDSRHSVIRP